MAAQQQQQQGDNSLAPLWITILLFITLGLIWYFAHAYIVTFVFKVKLLEADLASYFTNALNQTIAYIKETPAASVTFKEMAAVSAKVGDYVRYPMAGVLVVLALMLYFNNITLKFRKTYSMKRLREEEYPNWPQITPIVKLDLLNQDIDKGPWAMSLTPVDFAKRYDLLKSERLTVPENVLHRKVAPTVAIKKGEARKVFSLQLGPFWTGPENLPKHTRAIFAAFAARMNRDRDGSANLLHQMAASTKTGKINYSGVNALLRKHFNTEAVQKVVQRHAYVYSTMASMLQRAREDGVLPAAEFLWIKPIDRRLWYILNTVGRQTPFPEVSGIFAHWLAEKELENRIMVPMINEAVKALEIAVKEVKFKPEDFAVPEA